MFISNTKGMGVCTGSEWHRGQFLHHLCWSLAAGPQSTAGERAGDPGSGASDGCFNEFDNPQMNDRELLGVLYKTETQTIQGR